MALRSALAPTGRSLSAQENMYWSPSSQAHSIKAQHGMSIQG